MKQKRQVYKTIFMTNLKVTAK